MRALRTGVVVGLPLWLAACVTINIYFPAAAAEKAADRIIEDVWGKPVEEGGEGQPAPAPEGEQQSRAPGSLDGAPAWAVALLDILVPPAHAAEPDFDISSPGIRSIQASMRGRHGRLAPYYNSGAVGLTKDGEVAIVDPGAISLRERNQVRQLVADENADRDALYREIARANGHPEWESKIRETFARRWIANAQRGWKVQDASGNWRGK
jgi:uncharacterized protein YdbL (DUF1318 family)